MSTQIFKNKIPNEIVLDMLHNTCIKTEKYYLFNNNAFKKGIVNNSIPEFLEIIKSYYHLSKQKYVEGDISYKKLTTILRQICNFNKIIYVSKIKYEKSFYEIHYYIYF